jgi:hypothetical protein
MQPLNIEGNPLVPKPASVVVIVIQCVMMAALFTSAGLVLASAIVNWANLA